MNVRCLILNPRNVIKFHILKKKQNDFSADNLGCARKCGAAGGANDGGDFDWHRNAAVGATPGELERCGQKNWRLDGNCGGSDGQFGQGEAGGSFL